jgi:hypothetical protein
MESYSFFVAPGTRRKNVTYAFFSSLVHIYQAQKQYALYLIEICPLI